MLSRISGGLIELGSAKLTSRKLTHTLEAPLPASLRAYLGEGLGLGFERMSGRGGFRGARLQQGIRFQARFFCAPTISFEVCIRRESTVARSIACFGSVTSPFKTTSSRALTRIDNQQAATIPSSTSQTRILTHP